MCVPTAMQRLRPYLCSRWNTEAGPAIPCFVWISSAHTHHTKEHRAAVESALPVT